MTVILLAGWLQGLKPLVMMALYGGTEGPPFQIGF
jgi:hypothetical protein